MSPQNIPLKGRNDSWDPAEFRPQRPFAFEVRRVGNAARAYVNVNASSAVPRIVSVDQLFLPADVLLGLRDVAIGLA
jgi:hypothetical protein